MKFRSRCRQLGIKGVTLHSYRYAWAERAKTCGMQERFAQEALGHNSKAVHRAHAKRALMKIPSLENYEQRAAVKVDPLLVQISSHVLPHSVGSTLNTGPVGKIRHK